MSRSTIRVSIFENLHDQTKNTIDVRATYYFDGDQEIIQVNHTFPIHIGIGAAYDLMVTRLTAAIGETMRDRALRGD